MKEVFHIGSAVILFGGLGVFYLLALWRRKREENKQEKENANSQGS